jgi:hypothetical protein
MLRDMVAARRDWTVARGFSKRQFGRNEDGQPRPHPKPHRVGMGSHHAAALTVESLGRSLRGSQESQDASLPAVCRITTADIRDILVKGLDDFGAYRTDVIFLCLIYPLVGMALAWLTFGYEMLPLLFPLVSFRTCRPGRRGGPL